MTTKQRHALHLFLAEKVMGWKLRAPDEERGPNQFWIVGNGYVMPHGFFGNPWQPTIDYGQALMVLEKCLKKISPCNLAMWEESGCKRIAAAMPEDYFFSKSKSLPEAICLFAKEVFRE